MIDVTLLGTAATLPRPERALASAALMCDGRAILFDCGEGTQMALHRQHVNPMRIDLICLSHYHGDHIFGLPGLLQTMSTMGRTAPLYITGPEGLEAAMAPILALAQGIPQEDLLPYPVHLLNMPQEGLTMQQVNHRWPGRARLLAFPTCHRVVSQGYRFELGRCGRFDGVKAEKLGIPQKSWRHLQAGQAVMVGERRIEPEDVCGATRPGLAVVFTGDTAPCDTLRVAAKGADLLLMDATYAEDFQADKAERYGHSTFAQSAHLAAEAEVGALWLMHYSASIPDPEAALPLAQAHFPATCCGQDGLKTTLTFRKKA